MPRPRESSSEGSRSAREDGGRSDSADSSSESNNRRSGASESGSSSSSSSSVPASGSTGSSGSSISDSGSSEREAGGRKAIVSYESGRSSGATSASRRGGGSSSSSSSSESSGLAEGGGGGTLKSRMKALFKKQEVGVAEPQELGDINDRVDAKLLAGVQEYEAAPSEAASYGVNTFWDGRYAEDLEVVEWYHPWANLAPTLTQYMDEQDQVLVCGCGNSEMSVDMYDDGFENIFNADISRVVIDQMVDTCKEYPMEWKSVDLTREAFSAERFDVALDKGCLDSIVCSTQVRADNYLQQIDRILQPEGAFICVSFAPPEDRLEMLEYWDLDQPDKCLAWDVHVDAIAKPELQRGRGKHAESDGDFYIYVCIKDPGKAAQKRLAKERVKREQEKKLAKMLGFKGRGRGRSRGGGAR